MGSRIGNHFRVRRTWAPRGSGSGLRVRRENGSTRSVSDNGSRSCRIREEGLGWRRGLGFVLVGVDLVVAKILSGPRHQVGLGIRGEELGILEEVLVVSVKKIMSVHGVRSSGSEGVLGVAERKS